MLPKCSGLSSNPTEAGLWFPVRAVHHRQTIN